MNIIIKSFLIFYSISSMAASTVQSASKAGQHPLTCTGNFGQSGLLQNVGFTEEDLKKGIPCEISDFDGNGSNDFWFTKCDAKLKCPATVVLMNKVDVIKAISVQPEVVMDVLNLGPGFNHASLKDLGCKFPKNGALIKMGEGDGNANIIYTLKPDLSGFVKFSECDNVESVD
ncbi:MAG: hypothetical protein V4598_06125 [Bdellovibrionota bacterium]